MPDYRALAQTIAADLVAWRRDFHQHPEIGFHEFRTAGIVAEHLRALGIETATGVGKTGVVGVIEGAGPGPIVLVRVDMDALPVTEETGLPFASQTPGMMHACGHDGHTAIGMGLARLLVETAAEWPGKVKLLFQPAEEGLGGAMATIADGVLTNPTPHVAFGLHLWNQMPSGIAAAQAGPLMAGADHFTIVITGKGGHGAQPHTTVDAILVAVQAVSALHTIVSRNVPPQETAVLSVGSFQGGTAFNVIAEQVTLTGTLRTFSAEVRELLLRRMEEILAGVCAAHGARYTFALGEFTPAVLNNAAAAEVAGAAAETIVGPENVQQIRPLMVAEDMAEIMNRVGGHYLLLGASPAGGADGAQAPFGPHHNPRFDFDEAMLPVAVALLAETAVRYLRGNQ